jgi:hypothetical protein
MKESKLADENLRGESVILLHGLARTNRSLSKLEDKLKQQGFRVINATYPSRKHTVQELVEPTINEALAKCKNSQRVHFITHSMGGILVRAYLKNNTVNNLGRIVMLGPPNKGSQVVDRLKNLPGFKLINGPAGMQLGTNVDDLPNTLGPVDYDVGVIAGSKSVNLILSMMLPSPNDGKVSVENTKLVGMNDHIVMPVTHPFMMKNNKVIYQVLHYLRKGRFNANISTYKLA